MSTLKKLLNRLAWSFGIAFLTAGIFQLLERYNIKAWYVFILLGFLLVGGVYEYWQDRKSIESDEDYD